MDFSIFAVNMLGRVGAGSPECVCVVLSTTTVSCVPPGVLVTQPLPAFPVQNCDLICTDLAVLLRVAVAGSARAIDGMF